MPVTIGSGPGIGRVIARLRPRVRRNRGAAEDHRDQGFRHQQGQCEVDHQKSDDRRHAEEMQDARDFVAAEQPVRYCSCTGFQMLSDRTGSSPEWPPRTAPVENLLHSVVFAQPMAGPAARRRAPVSSALSTPAAASRRGWATMGGFGMLRAAPCGRAQRGLPPDARTRCAPPVKRPDRGNPRRRRSRAVGRDARAPPAACSWREPNVPCNTGAKAAGVEIRIAGCDFAWLWRALKVENLRR